MKIELVALDLDGTLLNSKKEVTSEVKQIMTQKSEEGIIFTIATGRAYSELFSVLNQTETPRYAILANGAYTIDLTTGEIIDKRLLSMDDVRAVYDAMAGRNMIFELYTDTTVYSSFDSRERIEEYGLGYITELIERSRTYVEDMGSFISTYSGDVAKVNIFFTDEQQRSDALKVIKTLPYNSTCQLKYNIEINSKGVNKGVALEALATHLGMDRFNVMAIGDNMNDKEMLEYAAISVSMYNAIDEIKLISNYFTKSHDEDGVAFALKHFLR